MMANEKAKAKGQARSIERQISLCIRDLMKQHRISVCEIAQKFGVAQSTMSNRFRNGYKWGLQDYMVLAHLFNMKVGTLIATVQATVEGIQKCTA